MAITFDVQPGYQFSASERVTYSKLNLLGTPGISLAGTVDSSEITDGAVTTQKLADSIDINAKVDDHNLALTKLAAGTHGQILYYDANSDLVTLPPGTDGYFLRTKGSGADPEWASQTGISSVPYTDITTNGNDKYLTTDSSGNIEWINKPTVTLPDSFITTGNANSIFAATGKEEVVPIVDSGGVAYTPEHLRVTLYCEATDSDTGYDAGDELELGHNFWSGVNQNRNAVIVIYDASSQSVVVKFNNNTSSVTDLRILGKSGANAGKSVTASSTILGNFKFKIRTWQSGFASSGSNAGPLTSDPGYYFSGLSSGTAGDYIFATTTAGRQAVFNHGLGGVPKLARAVLVATSDVSELGLVAGDEVDANDLLWAEGGNQWDMVCTKFTASQVRLNISLDSSGRSSVPYLNNYNNNKLIQLTSDIASRMKFKIYAWK